MNLNMNLINNYKIGADPEMFVLDSNDNPLIAIPFIPGSKSEPHDIGKGCFIQTDNVMVEYNVPATTNYKTMHNNIEYVKSKILEFLPKGSKLVNKASMHFELLKLMEYDEAMVFGCDPEYSIYTKTPYFCNEDPCSSTLRSAGGHIHIGYDNPSPEGNDKLIMALDLFLHVPSLKLDLDFERKKMYGKAGAHRIKPYGVEYRSLSNFWTDSEVLINWTFKQIKKAVIAVNKNLIIEKTCFEIAKAINNAEYDKAITLAEEVYDINKQMPKMLILK